MGKETVETVIAENFIIGEGPHWDHENKVLYLVDIKGKSVHKFNPETGKQHTVKVDKDTVSFVTPIKNQKDKFLIGLGRTITIMTWNGESSTPSNFETIATVDEEEGKKENRLNDGKADSSGRLWAGTMGKETGQQIVKENGALFSLSQNRNINKHLVDISCSNGIAWSPDNKTMYYTDSFTFKVDAFDFNIQTGTLSNRRAIFDYEANKIAGIPDGMTIDTNGNLWIACFNGSQVIQVDPLEGKLLKSISLPSPKITSVAFGGPNLDELYVTSASVDFSEEEKSKYPAAGYTYRIRNIDAKGLPMYEAVL